MDTQSGIRDTSFGGAGAHYICSYTKLEESPGILCDKLIDPSASADIILYDPDNSDNTYGKEDHQSNTAGNKEQTRKYYSLNQKLVLCDLVRHISEKDVKLTFRFDPGMKQFNRFNLKFITRFRRDGYLGPFIYKSFKLYGCKMANKRGDSANKEDGSTELEENQYERKIIQMELDGEVEHLKSQFRSCHNQTGRQFITPFNVAESDETEYIVFIPIRMGRLAESCFFLSEENIEYFWGITTPRLREWYDCFVVEIILDEMFSAANNFELYVDTVSLDVFKDSSADIFE